MAGHRPHILPILHRGSVQAHLWCFACLMCASTPPPVTCWRSCKHLSQHACRALTRQPSARTGSPAALHVLAGEAESQVYACSEQQVPMHAEGRHNKASIASTDCAAPLNPHSSITPGFGDALCNGLRVKEGKEGGGEFSCRLGSHACTPAVLCMPDVCFREPHSNLLEFFEAHTQACSEQQVPMHVEP
jgi:hypothetical protein